MPGQRPSLWSMYKSASAVLTGGERLILLLIAVDSVVGPIAGIGLTAFGSGTTRAVGIGLLVFTVLTSAIGSPLFRVRVSRRYGSAGPRPARPADTTRPD